MTLIFLSDLSNNQSNYARRKGSKDKQKRKSKLGTAVGSSSLLGAGAGGISSLLKNPLAVGLKKSDRKGYSKAFGYTGVDSKYKKESFYKDKAKNLKKYLQTPEGKGATIKASPYTEQSTFISLDNKPIMNKRTPLSKVALKYEKLGKKIIKKEAITRASKGALLGLTAGAVVYGGYRAFTSKKKNK